MRSPAKAALCARTLFELIRYDVLFALRGLRGVRPAAGRRAPVAEAAGAELEFAICEAAAAVAPIYWKPIRCLQRSIVITRVMRSRGIPAQVVVGYRPAPFFSHAWVEVEGRAVSDSPVYQKRLLVLERL